MQKILLIDNYDSFTFNLVQILRETRLCEVIVRFNDQVSCEEASAYDKIVISPGPGLPYEAGNIIELIRKLGPEKPILGICLGHQAIAEVYGAKLYRLDRIAHGKDCYVHYLGNDPYLYKGIKNPFRAGRYHSWSVSPDNFPNCMEITAFDSENNIMALKHKTFPVRGFQFHPESIMTPSGKTFIRNWCL